LFIIRFFNTN